MKSFTKVSVLSIVGMSLISFGVIAHADIKQIKAYKEAFPESKPKCIECHVDEKPKKDDGAHEANDYGKAVVAAAGAEEPTADAYKTVGKIEDFKK